MTFLFVWFLCGLICAGVANSKGRSGGGWFVLGILFGIIAVIVVLCVPALKECPHCKKMIKREAMVCYECHTDLVRRNQ